MAINLRCSCGGESKLTAKRCSRCGEPFPKKGRRYKVTDRINGRKVTRTVKNLELAREIEGKLHVDIKRKEFDLERKIVPALSEVWDKFLPWSKEHKKSWKSDLYVYQKHLEPIFKDRALDQISQFDVEKIMIGLKKGLNKHGRPYAPATIKHVVVLLSRLYSLAAQWGLYVGKNPCKHVRLPKLNNQVTEYLTRDELTKLLNLLDNWPSKEDAGFIKLLLYTGLRRGELFKLRWNDVNLSRQTVTLVDPKGKKNEILPLSGKAIDVLQSFPQGDSEFVFPGRKGKQRVEFKRPWIDIKKKAGLSPKFRLHGLRHHFASSLVSAGVDLYTVSKLLTHKDLKTTMRYAHLDDKVLKDAVQLSDELQEPKENEVSESVKRAI